MTIGLGTGRFFLAFLVVISHLCKGMIDGPAVYAVWGFFVLSGFLITHVLRHKYGHTSKGLIDFARNRILRIFPLYYIAVLAGVLCLLVLPKYGVSLAALNPQFNWPHHTWGWAINLVLLAVPTPGLLVPVSSALAVEVCAYALMPLLAFNRTVAWFSLTASALLNLKYGLTLETFPERYSLFFPCFMAFSCGCLLSQYRAKLAFLAAPKLSITVWILHCLIRILDRYWPWTYGMYLSLFLSAWVIISLASQKPGKMDSFLGDLAYPVYLFHTTVAVCLIPLGFKMRSFSFFLVAFLITLLISMFLVKLIDKPLARLKKNKVEVL